MTRGFVLGATAGRTTLNGEGLQHEDGHSLLLASTNPAVVAYDPAFAFELGHIVQDALRRMYGDDAGEDLLLPHALQRALRRSRPSPRTSTSRASCAASTATPPRPRATGPRHSCSRPASPCSGRWRRSGCCRTTGTCRPTSGRSRRGTSCAATGWPPTSTTSCSPTATLRVPYVTRKLEGAPGPFVAVSDFMRAVQDQIGPWVPGDFASLGTDGFGLSDTRGALRRHFKVDAASIVVQDARRAGPTRRGQGGGRARGDRPLPARRRHRAPRRRDRGQRRVVTWVSRR